MNEPGRRRRSAALDYFVGGVVTFLFEAAVVVAFVLAAVALSSIILILT